MDPRVRRLLMLAVLAIAALPAVSASSHPPSHIDQRLQPEPACDATAFPVASSSANPLLQEFIPAADGLGAVDLCLEVPAESASFTLAIRPGPVTAPGAAISSQIVTLPGSGPRWVHIELPAAVPTGVGSRYTIEIPNSTAIRWRRICGGPGPGCAVAGPDLYPNGVSAPPAETQGGDFGFRTYRSQAIGFAIGPADQKHTGDPLCRASTFRGSASSSSPLRQEFVPLETGLAAVDLCIQTFDDFTPFRVRIREGTVHDPGDVIASVEAFSLVAGFQWVRATLDPTIPLDRSAHYVIEVPSSVTFQWRKVCGTTGGSCTTIDPDGYSEGVSNASDGADFGFRTIPGQVPRHLPGTADQHLDGDPACDEASFKTFVSNPLPVRQEFVPTSPGLDAVDLCLEVPQAPATVTLNIRSGNASSPGPILGSAEVTIPREGVQWVRFDLAGTTPTTPGQLFVIEIPESTAVRWRATCSQPVGGCTAGQPDAYGPGASNLAGVGDFGFRTIGGTPFRRTIPFLARTP